MSSFGGFLEECLPCIYFVTISFALPEYKGCDLTLNQTGVEVEGGLLTGEEEVLQGGDTRVEEGGRRAQGGGRHQGGGAGWQSRSLSESCSKNKESLILTSVTFYLQVRRKKEQEQESS